MPGGGGGDFASMTPMRERASPIQDRRRSLGFFRGGNNPREEEDDDDDDEYDSEDESPPPPPQRSPPLLYCRYRPKKHKVSPKKETTFFRKNTVVNFTLKKSTMRISHQSHSSSLDIHPNSLS